MTTWTILLFKEGMKMSKTVIPQHEPEVVAAGAQRRFHGDDEKIPTTSLNPIVVDRVTIESRYGKANELELMRRFVLDLSPHHRRLVARIWCDSKAMHSFSVVLRHWKEAETIGRAIEASAMTHSQGHNGISIVAQDRHKPANVFGDRNLGEHFIDANWSGPPAAA
jgi:hypothetical protein